MRSSIKVIFLVLLYVFSLPAFSQADTVAEMMKAGNRRDIDDEHIILGLASSDADLVQKTLVAIGNIGGEKAAEFIKDKLSDPRSEVRYSAALAAGIVGEAPLFDILKAAATAEDDPRVKARLYHSMGYITPEEMRAFYGLELLGHNNPVIQRGLLDGYMQSIVYSKVKASEFPYTNYNMILDIAKGAGDEAVAAAYLLARLEELETALTPQAVVSAINAAQSPSARMQLVRVLGKLGGDNSSLILPYLSHKAGAVRLEAIRGMGKARDPMQIIALQAASLSEFAVIRKAVIDVFAASDDKDFIIQGKSLMDRGLTDKSVWVQGASLRGLNRISKGTGEHLAELWYNVSGSYRKGYAIEILAGVEAFKYEFEATVNDKSNPYLQNKARAALDMPERENDTPPQPVVSFEEAVRASLARIRFETTKGTILVQLSTKTPFTAYNFIKLASKGVLDGMLFHRVIGNFVAQAGERITPLHEDWGPIREEWTDLSHEIGTVGLATSGKDTGTRQFFFNTAHNRHLDGRYTVFGKVIEGLNVMMNLEEGDKIITATVEQ